MACDFYHRYPEDVALLRELGACAFRFSVAWPRVLPEGRGKVNEPGLDFYDRLVDELLANEIAPVVDPLPLGPPAVALEDAGGWPERATAEAFCEFAEVVGPQARRPRLALDHPQRALGRRLARLRPRRARTRPGVAAGRARSRTPPAALARARGRRDPGARRRAREVGITLDLTQAYPASSSEADAAAALAADGRDSNRWFLDPVFKGAYPEDVLAALAPDAPPVRDGDLAAIATPIDFLGVNYYRREIVAGDPLTAAGRCVHQPDSMYTAMGWEVSPHGLYDLLAASHDEYGPAADPRDGERRRLRRRPPATTASSTTPSGRRSSQATSRRSNAQSPTASRLRGYFVWSLLDNFEWAHGYGKRFGIVYVDYPTLSRIPKSSFSWYRDLIAHATTLGA